MGSSSPVNARTMWAAHSPSGIARTWLANSSLMELSQVSLPRRSAVSCSRISSNRGDIISGCLPKSLVMSSLSNRFKRSLTSMPAHSPTGRWYCVWMRRPICNLDRGLLERQPTRPGLPTRLEHEYKRAGALHLFAAFDTRTGKVYARTEVRKRQVEFLAFLSQLERELPPASTRVFLVMDNLSVHKGKQVRAWLATHPRFVCHFVPVHCSWMNQVEQWFSIVQRKRLRISDFANLDDLAERLMAFVSEWNAYAHPFNWSTKSAAKVMAKYQAQPRLAPAA